MNPNAKGRELENAVHAIESVILASAPGLREQCFTIEARKRIKVGGVHHEIDILVTTEIARGYGSTFIFECKNWEDAVGKNEIIVFSEKIDAVRANHGYFVAKSFTKDAEAQAQKDDRITLLAAMERDPAMSIIPESFHATAPASCKPFTTFRVAGSTGTNTTPIDVHSAKICVDGHELLLEKYLNSWIEEIYADRLLTFWTTDLPEGVHPMMAAALRTFEAGECFIDGREMGQVSMEIEFGVRILRPPVISDYEVSSRGRVIRLANVDFPGVSFAPIFVRAFEG
jgi:hypothetical protein